MHSTPQRWRGFTLVELLLVIAIIGVITAVTLPQFVRSIRGQRLRTAARSIVMAGRYARSMAVMKQTEMALALDLESGRIRVGPIETVAPPSEALPGSDDLPGVTMEAGNGTVMAPGASSERAVTSFAAAEISRQIDPVTIRYVVLDTPDEETVTSGTVLLVYRTNGTCTPYHLEIEEPQGGRLLIEVDSLSGVSIETP